jgi:hypothetical protein
MQYQIPGITICHDLQYYVNTMKRLTTKNHQGPETTNGTVQTRTVSLIFPISTDYNLFANTGRSNKKS